MGVPADFNNLKWYGRGPYENYQDRHMASFVGLYSVKVDDQQEPYIRPQEYGNKTNVRWMTLTNNNGKGLKFTGMPYLSMSALPYAIEDLDPGVKKKNVHPGDLTKRNQVFVNLDLIQMGVGGDNSWGALPYDRYRVFPKDYAYSFKITPVE
jgi:beta-galactosidase